MNSQEARRITRARTQLVLHYPFWGALALHLTPREDPTLARGTMANDGRTLYYDPATTTTWTDQQLMGVVAHEVGHCVFSHLWRRNNRDPRRWNMACDHALNHVLVDDGIELPPGALLDPQFHGMPAEAIYPLLQTQLQTQGGDGAGGSAKGGSPTKGRGSGGTLDDPDKWRDATSGQGSQGSQSESDGNSGQSVQGSDPADGGDEAGSLVWRERVAQAATYAKMIGRLPGRIAELITELLEPKVDWRDLLQEYIQASVHDNYRLLPPNRKHLWRGIYLPSLHGQHLELVVVMDTSGSISSHEATVFLSELHGIAEQYASFTVHLIQCDSSVNGYWALTEEDEGDWPFEVRGRGGTSFIPPFRYVEDTLAIVPDAMVYMTDLYGPFPEEPDYPVIWLATTNEVAPFGTTIKMGL